MTQKGFVDFPNHMARCLTGGVPAKLGVALSGGSDSTALLDLMQKWAQPRGIVLKAVTVNHGLRDEAGAEAAQAAEFCRSRGVGHAIVTWTGWSGEGNLQAEARKARRALISDWARRQNINVVALGHTLDDQAETLLARLLRGSGVDGLSAMAGQRQAAGVLWIRPLLGYRRDALQQHLRARGIDWADDPSNHDDLFERVRLRRVIALLEDLGFTAEGLAKTAADLARARTALEAETLRVARELAHITKAGDVEFPADKLFALTPEIRLRLVSHALRWVSGADYRPRLSSLEAMLERLQKTGRDTLSGCLVSHTRESILRFAREPAAVAKLRSATDALWDGRWRATRLAGETGCELAALGEDGLKTCPDWRATGLPRHSLLAAPAIWQGDTLVAAPLAGAPNGWKIWLAEGEEQFFTSVFSH